MIHSQPSQAQASRFFCQVAPDNIPTTYAQTQQGSVPVIKWRSEYFPDYPPLKRCQEVSTRFANYHAQGMLDQLSSGYQNRQPVICAGTSCTGNNLLFTLRPDQNPGQVLKELMANRASAAGPSWQSSDPSGTYITIDLNQYLRLTPVENFNGSPADPPTRVW